jgi:hypothetical protein
MSKALNHVRPHYTYCLDLKTYNNFTTVREAHILLLERKITGDEQNTLVVLPPYLCSDIFHFGRLWAQE